MKNLFQVFFNSTFKGTYSLLPLGTVVFCLLLVSCEKQDDEKDDVTPVLVDYTVTFDLNSTDATGLPKPQKVNENEKATKPTPDPIRTGYDFKGWFKESTATTLFNFDTETVTGNDIKLYAGWEVIIKKVFTVTSTTFKDGGAFPERAAVSVGGNGSFGVSPQLSFNNAPVGTTSYVVLMEDITLGDDIHWFLRGVTQTNLPENIAADANFMSNHRESSYFGPAPPGLGSTHTYKITVFATNIPSNKSLFPIHLPSSGYEVRIVLSQGSVLAEASIEGTYTGK